MLGEENGNPLQYCCLENSMDSRAWHPIVHGVEKSWTGLSIHANKCWAPCDKEKTQTPRVTVNRRPRGQLNIWQDNVNKHHYLF